MNKVKGLSIIAIILLILQILSASVVVLADTKSKEFNQHIDSEKIAVRLASHENDLLTWRINVNAAQAEHEGITLELFFDADQTYLDIEANEQITSQKIADGYELIVPAGNAHEEIILHTNIPSENVAKVDLRALAHYGETEITASLEVLLVDESTEEMEVNENPADLERVVDEAASEELSDEEEAIPAFKTKRDASSSDVPQLLAQHTTQQCTVPKPGDNITPVDFDKDTYSKDVRDYNAIVFGNHTFSGGETEGATAVQGNVSSIGTIDYGSTNRFGGPGTGQIGVSPLPENTPGLILGGEITGIAAIYNGVVMTQTADSACGLDIRNGDRIYDDQTIINQVFVDFKTYINDHQAILNFFNTGIGISPNSSGNMDEDLRVHFVPSTENEKVLTLNITGDKLNMKSFHFPNLDAYEKVIIYSDAREIKFGNGSMLYEGGVIDTQAVFGTAGNQILHNVASKVTWSFPNAETIVANGYSIVGTVIAPNAIFSSTGGSLSGQAFVKDLKTGVYSFNQIRNTVEEPSPGLGQIQITKVDADDHSITLKEATFNILSEAGDIVGELATDENGVAISERLDIGDYTLVEIEAPDGYELVTEIFTVTVEKDETTEITIENSKFPDPLGQIQITKIDAADESIKLQGATFIIVDQAGDIVGELITDEDGMAISEMLPAGDYSLEETEAPDDYELLTEVITLTVTEFGLTKITIENNKITDPLGEIKIIKVDASDNEKRLIDAEFTLSNELGEEIARGRTNNQGELHFPDLILGKYFITETKAPEGYRVLTAKIELEITKGNTHIEHIVENKEIDWIIPDTGGIGTLAFYGIGLVLIALALWFLLRRRKV